MGKAGDQRPALLSVAEAEVTSGKEEDRSIPAVGSSSGAITTDNMDRRQHPAYVAPVANTEPPASGKTGSRLVASNTATGAGSGGVSTHFEQEVSTSQAASVTDLKKYKLLRENDVTPEVSTHFYGENEKVSTDFDRKMWKRSRVKSGYLIRRIKGYDISEDEYGVSYLYVISRSPKKKTSADFSVYEHAGFFTWHTLGTNGRLTQENRNDRKRLNGNRNRAS